MLLDECEDLIRRHDFLWTGLLLDDLTGKALGLALQDLVQRSFRMDSSFSETQESRVDHDACEPRGKRRPALKETQVGVCIAKAVLYCILGIFFVAQQSECSPIQHTRVTSEEKLLGMSIPGDSLLNDRPLFSHGAWGDSSVRIRLH